MNQGKALAKRLQMPTTILNSLATWQIKLRGLLDKHHLESHHCNMRKEFLTPLIILKML
jgi:hypothetical protein